jgi:mTERF domain-containing protein, mitochondrial
VFKLSNFPDNLPCYYFRKKEQESSSAGAAPPGPPLRHHDPPLQGTDLLSSPPQSMFMPFSPQRLLSAIASTISPKPFAVEEYLVATCGLTQPHALKASKRLYHLKSPCNPDAVLAFLSGLGMPRSDIATLVARDPLFLCSSVEKTLAPRVADLTDLGLSRPQIARLISVALNSFRTKSLCGNFSFWISVFDSSFETFLRALMLNAGILKVSIEKVAMPNLDFLQQCGISVSEFAVMNKYSSRVFCLKPMALREAAERVEELGIKCGSGMFRHALAYMALMRKEDFSKKIELLHKIGFSQDDALVVARKAPSVLSLSDEKIQQVMYFLTKIGFSQDDALVVVRKAPSVLSFSDKKIRKVMDFLTKNVGLEAPYIA